MKKKNPKTKSFLTDVKNQGGHTWVGHDDEVRSEIAKLLLPLGRP
jgi:hypothetical protein